MDDRARWDARYRDAKDGPAAPCAALVAAAPFLPAQGVALDLACGLGGNALWLAAHGFETHAWDIAPEAIVRVQAAAERAEVAIDTAVRDVEAESPAADSFDVLVVSHFLSRAILPDIACAVRGGGVLVYQTFCVGHTGPGPRNPDYLLRPNELAELCAGWDVLHEHAADGQLQWVARKANR